MKAIIFDLGDTLIEYEGLPLSWEDHYTDALRRLASTWRFSPSDAQLGEARSILLKYNTRHNPRDREVAFATILQEIVACWGTHLSQPDELFNARPFFQVFRQRLRCFPETKTVLRELRRKGIATGIFTDVPYGMPRELVDEDIREKALEGQFDALLTSRDTGFRKPRIETIAAVAAALSCGAHEVIHVGNEKKDVDVARIFGCRAVLIRRKEEQINWGQDQTIASLSALLSGT